ncbi:hypothetical protein BU25DRAFT_420288 [Macroventuria anomochaeta]|uniref:Uncharacterized protein n=1 Tax=Macroventuria anomochaeta TaxID=301207 RepID=A0ACB6S5Y1_9PLEO|nr:uncharacterized protein BU25DRAFT_420288 [Macroventuria anomochaeta]KAF2629448.1 hypothetical protein BU25DRAFT_420288 [Macroventuria anomochaeta]
MQKTSTGSQNNTRYLAIMDEEMASLGISSDLNEKRTANENHATNDDVVAASSPADAHSDHPTDTTVCYIAIATLFLLSLLSLISVSEATCTFLTPQSVSSTFTILLKNLYCTPSNSIHFASNTLRKRFELAGKSEHKGLFWILVGIGFGLGLVVALGMSWYLRRQARRRAARVVSERTWWRGPDRV